MTNYVFAPNFIVFAPKRSKKELSRTNFIMFSQQKWIKMSNELSPLDFSVEEIASGLTLIDLEVFKLVKPDELTSCSWNKKSVKWQIAPNVVKFTQRFNHVSFWVIEEILKPGLSRERVEVLNFFICLNKKSNRIFFLTFTYQYSFDIIHLCFFC